MWKPRNKRQAMTELRKCAEDPKYFIKNYIQISHPIRGLIPFKTYDFQDDLLDTFASQQFTTILKSRQLGISTITGAFILWMILFQREKTVLVLANKKETSAEMVLRVQKMYEAMPKWIRDIITATNKNVNSFVLKNGSRIIAQATTSNSSRGYACSVLVVDEAAFVDGLDEIWKSVHPTLSTGGSAIILSTPNGQGNFFHRTWVGAVDGTNGFFPVKLPWDCHPERDREWLEKTKANMSERDFAQEYGCDFAASGHTFIDPKDIERIEKKLLREPYAREEFDRNLWIWDEVREGHKYVISADVARGDGLDFSAFHIIDLDTMEQVAEYKGKLAYDHFARMLDKWGRCYGNALIVVENNKLGFAVCEELQRAQYPNLYFSRKKSHEFVESYDAAVFDDVTPGFTTSEKTRDWALNKMEEYVRKEEIQIRSARTLNEMRSFIWKITARGGRAQAQEGYNDDLIISLAIACWVRDTALLVNERAVAYDRALLDAMILKKKEDPSKKAEEIVGYDRNFNLVYAPKGEDQESQATKAVIKNGWLIW